jgi:hypothetical protein
MTGAPAAGLRAEGVSSGDWFGTEATSSVRPSSQAISSKTIFSRKSDALYFAY